MKVFTFTRAAFAIWPVLAALLICYSRQCWNTFVYWSMLALGFHLTPWAMRMLRRAFLCPCGVLWRAQRRCRRVFSHGRGPEETVCEDKMLDTSTAGVRGTSTGAGTASDDSEHSACQKLLRGGRIGCQSCCSCMVFLCAWLLLVYPSIFLAVDTCHYYTTIAIWDDAARTAKFYNSLFMALPRDHDEGMVRDYTWSDFGLHFRLWPPRIHNNTVYKKWLAGRVMSYVQNQQESVRLMSDITLSEHTHGLFPDWRTEWYIENRAVLPDDEIKNAFAESLRPKIEQSKCPSFWAPSRPSPTSLESSTSNIRLVYPSSPSSPIAAEPIVRGNEVLETLLQAFAGADDPPPPRDDERNCTTIESKFHFWRKLARLSEGDTMLDIGCGMGAWLEYSARVFNVSSQRGLHGVTLSYRQKEIITSRNESVFFLPLTPTNSTSTTNTMNTIHVGDMRKLDEIESLQKFRTTNAGGDDHDRGFDIITLLGSTEHICQGVIMRPNICIDKLSALLSGVKEYLGTRKGKNHRGAGAGGRIILHTLVLHDDFFDILRSMPSKPRAQTAQGLHLLARVYAGHYLRLKDWLQVFKNTGLKVVELHDTTNDYYTSSVVDKKHFGQYANYLKHWMSSHFTIAGAGKDFDWAYFFDFVSQGTFDLLTDPFFLLRWFYHFSGAWMTQWGNVDGKTPMSFAQVLRSPVRSHDFLLEAMDEDSRAILDNVFDAEALLDFARKELGKN